MSGFWTFANNHPDWAVCVVAIAATVLCSFFKWAAFSIRGRMVLMPPKNSAGPDYGHGTSHIRVE